MRFVIPFLILSFTFTACRSDERSQADEQAPSIPFRIDGSLEFRRDSLQISEIGIEVARGDSALERGLMERTNIPDTVGMLFIFDTIEEQSFWMANTPTSLDLFFVAADSEIVRIQKYTKPRSATHYLSGSPVKYVVETKAGYADSHGIIEGDRVRWQVNER